MATQNFLGKVFGRNDEVIGIVENVSEQQTGMYEFMQGIQTYLESMEVRMIAEMSGMRKRFEEGMEEIKEIALNSSPAEVVKAIDNRTKEEEILRRFDEIKSKMDKVVARHLMHDLPLISKGVYKHPTFTQSGEEVYNAITEFITDLADVCGVKKEQYTNRKRYDVFFKNWQINSYKRMSVRTRGGGTNFTLLSAIIARGHVRQYIEYLHGVYMSERRRYE